MAISGKLKIMMVHTSLQEKDKVYYRLLKTSIIHKNYTIDVLKNVLAERW